MMFNDPMDAVMALAQQLKESKIGGTGLTPEGARSPLMTRNLSGGLILRQQKAHTVLATSKRTHNSVRRAASGILSAPLGFEHEDTPAENSEAQLYAATPSPSPLPAGIVGRLVFECTGERRLEHVPYTNRATTVKKQAAKRKLEDSFSGQPKNRIIKRAQRPTSAPPASSQRKTALESRAQSVGSPIPDHEAPMHQLLQGDGRSSFDLDQDVSPDIQHDVVVCYVPSTSGVFPRARPMMMTQHPQQRQLEEEGGNDMQMEDVGAGANGVAVYSPLSGPVNILPLVDNPDCGCPSITAQTLKCMMMSGGTCNLSNYILIDCRYVFEYNGGHIQGATNLSTPNEIESYLESCNVDWNTTALVFYCEFSSERAPRAFRHVRQQDRKRHFERMDLVSLQYPHMFVLQGGYSNFVGEAPQLCNPDGAYVTMHSAVFEYELKVCHKHVNEAWASIDPSAKNNPLARRRSGTSRKFRSSMNGSRMSIS